MQKNAEITKMFSKGVIQLTGNAIYVARNEKKTNPPAPRKVTKKFMTSSQKFRDKIQKNYPSPPPKKKKKKKKAIWFWGRISLSCSGNVSRAGIVQY